MANGTKTTHQVEFELEDAKARRAADKFAEDTQRKLDSINFKATVAAIEAGFELAERAANAAASVFKFTAGEAIEAEEANLKLSRAMKLVGDFTQEAVDEFDNYAKSMQAATGVSDEEIKSAAALAKNFRLVNDEAKLATQAALGLSVAFGDDLNASTESVARTFTGFLDKGLAKILPELKSLTREQLVAGEAARIIAERFPVAFSETTQGRIDRAKNSLSELGETFGKFLLPAIGQSADALSKFLNNLDEFTNRDFNLQRQFDGSGGVEAFARQGAAAFVNAQRERKYGEDPEIKRAAEAAAKAAKEAQIKAQRELDAARVKSEQEFQGIKLELEKSGLDSVAKIEADFDEKRRVVNEAARTGVIKGEQERIRLLGNLEREEAKLVFEERKRLREKERAEVAAAAADGFETLINGENLTSNQQLAAGAGIAANATKGEAGARNVVASAAGAVANAFLPGIGGIVKEIIDLLGQGPDKVRQTLTEFIQAIPKLVTNILSSIPTVILVILREIPKSLITFIRDGIPEIIDAFIEGIPQIISEIIKYIPQLVVGIVKAFIEAIPKIVKSFAEALVDAAKDFVNAIIDAAKNVGGLFGGDGADGGGFDFGDFLDPLDFFATGGRVPDLPQYRGDKYPAQLDAGEQVLSRDLSSKLERYLEGGARGGGPMVVELRIGSEVIDRVLIDMQNRGYRSVSA